VPVARPGAIPRWVGRALGSDRRDPQTAGMDHLQDDSGVSLRPPMRATWHAEASPPVLRHRFS